MGKSENNPQPNQIEGQEEQEKGKNKTHTNAPKKEGGSLGK